MACNCTWNDGPALDDITFPSDYDQKDESFEIKVELKGHLTPAASDKSDETKVLSKVRLSVYRYHAGDWQRIAKSRLEELARKFDCNGKKQEFSVALTEKVDLDSVHLAGIKLLLLVKAYYEVTGCGSTFGGYSEMRRFGVTLTATKPPNFKTQTQGQAWGPGENTDGNWILTTPQPGDPSN